jgi:hypothetical protein
MVALPATWPERFCAKVSADNDADACWEWTGATQTKGYGSFSVRRGRSVLAHRFAYESAIGPIPTNLQIDHLCRNKRCVNPTHLEPVTSKTNTLRGLNPTAWNARKVACIRGHVLEGANLFFKGVKRQCRACRAIHDAKYQSERRSDRRAI